MTKRLNSVDVIKNALGVSLADKHYLHIRLRFVQRILDGSWAGFADGSQTVDSSLSYRSSLLDKQTLTTSTGFHRENQARAVI